MSREVLVHLNVETGAGDTRSADEIANVILAALEVGGDHESLAGLTIVCPMAEEV